jgi:hypothetical protein
MDLTKEQMEAAKVCGCTFVPVAGEQVARLSMQRRVFMLDGRPFVATRDAGGFYETHATLAVLIETHSPGKVAGGRETVQQAAAADAVAEREMAGERGARGAQEVSRHSAAPGPRAPSRTLRHSR